MKTLTPPPRTTPLRRATTPVLIGMLIVAGGSASCGEELPPDGCEIDGGSLITGEPAVEPESQFVGEAPGEAPVGDAGEPGA